MPHSPRGLPIVSRRIYLLFLFFAAKFFNSVNNALSMCFFFLFFFSWLLAIAIFHFISYFLCHVIWALYTVLIHAIIIILLDCIIFKGVSFSIHLLEARLPRRQPAHYRWSCSDPINSTVREAFESQTPEPSETLISLKAKLARLYHWGATLGVPLNLRLLPMGKLWVKIGLRHWDEVPHTISTRGCELLILPARHLSAISEGARGLKPPKCGTEGK